MSEYFPKSVLKKASKRGNEYAWKFSDVPKVVLAAKRQGLGIIGGQAQFRLPDATCEMFGKGHNEF